jgi:hypothetical protein
MPEDALVCFRSGTSLGVVAGSRCNQWSEKISCEEILLQEMMHMPKCWERDMLIVRQHQVDGKERGVRVFYDVFIEAVRSVPAIFPEEASVCGVMCWRQRIRAVSRRFATCSR